MQQTQLKKHPTETLLGNPNKLQIHDLTFGLDLTKDVQIYDRKYFFEMLPFMYEGNYANLNNRLKYSFRILDMKKNLVSNDIHVKYFNELKTIFERNIHLYRFFRKMLTLKPLNLFGIIRNKIKDVFIKQIEVNYISGKFSPFRVLTVDINKKKHFYQEINVYNLIPYSIKSFFYNTFMIIKNLINKISFFITYKKRRRWLKTYIIGFKLVIRNKTHAKRKIKKSIFVLKRLVYFMKNFLNIPLKKVNKNKKKILFIKNHFFL